MKNSMLIAAVLVILILGCSTDSGSGDGIGGEKPNGEQPPVAIDMSIKVVAHRGAYQEFDLPENSKAALRKAIEIGVDVVECDVQLTKDAQLVVYHDEKVMGKFIKDQTYAELLSYPLANGENIPRLSEFISIVIEENFELWLDIKSLSEEAGGNERSIQVGEQAANLIREMEAEENIAYIVGRKAVLDKCIGAIQGDWEVAYMNTEYTALQFIEQGYSWANFNFDTFYQNRGLMENYLEQEIMLSFYTVDEAKIMDWFLDQKGIYAITTNRPEVLLSKVESKKIKK